MVALAVGGVAEVAEPAALAAERRGILKKFIRKGKICLLSAVPKYDSKTLSPELLQRPRTGRQALVFFVLLLRLLQNRLNLAYPIKKVSFVPKNSTCQDARLEDEPLLIRSQDGLRRRRRGKRGDGLEKMKGVRAHFATK